MTGWREVVLGDVCNRVTVGHVGKMATEYVDDGVYFLRSQNIKPFSISVEGLLRITEGFHRRISKSALKAGDVVVVRTGYPGTAAVVPPELDGSNCADLVVITPSEELNPHMLAALFNSAWGRSTVGGQLVGSAQQHFNVGSAKAMRLRLPSRPTQDQIAAILCSLGHLIENNRYRIVLLEQMARAIYTEWFVSFRYPGHEGAALVDSPLGPIPEGWQIRNLFDVADVAFGFSFKSKYFAPSGSYGVVRIRDVPAGITRTFTNETPPQRYRIADGDVLIGMDGDFHLRQWTGGEAWLNQRVARLRPLGNLTARHLRLAIEKAIQEWNTAISGTPVAHLGKRHLEQIRVVVPSHDVLATATEIFAGIADQQRVLVQSTRQLEAIRDMLLPRLVTGQLDASKLDLDALVSSVA